MYWAVLLLLLIPTAAQAQKHTHADASREAALDLMRLGKLLDAESLTYIRYLSIHNVVEKELWHEQLSLLINRLSRNKYITIPPRVGRGGIVIRLDLRDYDIRKEDFYKLRDVEPYFYEKFATKNVKITQSRKKVEKFWPGGPDATGRDYPKGYRYFVDETDTVQQDIGKPYREVRIASWLDPTATGVLVQLSQSETPIVRGDWFLANASKPPIYHDLLRLKTLDDVKLLALFDDRTNDQETRATVIKSGKLAERVATNNRLIFRRPTANGAWWETRDFDSSVGIKNMLNNFLTNEFDGSEIIFSLPNKLHGNFLINKNRIRVDSVPDVLAKDRLHEDGIVINGRSCFSCHKLGFQPFKSSLQIQVTSQKLTDLGLNVKNDPKKTAELARYINEVFGKADFDTFVKEDNLAYAAAMKKATPKRTPPVNAGLFLQLYNDYQEVDIDSERLTYEAGASDEDVKAAVKVKISFGQNDTLANNSALLQRLNDPPILIRRDQFEEAFPALMHSLNGWLIAKKKLK